MIIIKCVVKYHTRQINTSNFPISLGLDEITVESACDFDVRIHYWVSDFWSNLSWTCNVITSSISSLSYDRSKDLPKRALHIVRSRASSFKLEYPLLSLRSSSSFLRLLPRLRVTSIPSLTFPSITRCRRQFLRKMWPIQLAFRLLISCRIFLCSLTL